MQIDIASGQLLIIWLVMELTLALLVISSGGFVDCAGPFLVRDVII